MSYVGRRRTSYIIGATFGARISRDTMKSYVRQNRVPKAFECEKPLKPPLEPRQTENPDSSDSVTYETSVVDLEGAVLLGHRST